MAIVQREAAGARMSARRRPVLTRNRKAAAPRAREEMTMTNTAVVVVIAGFCLIVPAMADEATPDSGGGRYTFNKVADGFLRLDTQTGEVSVCSPRTVGWACQAAPEDRVVLENEIARLRHDNAALKRELLARGLPLPSGAMPEPPAVRDGDRLPRFGSNPDLQRMVALVGRMWRELVDAFARAQKQMLNKS
jgi:hypothetical protein